MKPTTRIAAALSGLLSLGLTQVQAAPEFSANVALTSDYVWRGISQTLEDPAIQGGFDVDLGNGIALGTWASNVDFGGDAHIELDFYGGYSLELGGVGVDLGAAYYTYPSDSDLDFLEFSVGASMSLFSASLAYTDEFGKDGPDYTYFNLGVDYELAAAGGVGLGASIGFSQFGGDLEDYNDWKIYVAKSLGGFDFELAYTDTDIEKSNDPDGLASGRAVLSLARSF